MSWKSWAARIGGYAAAPWTGGASIPIGEAIAQGIGAHEAINKAEKQQAAGTTAANATIGQTYNQQRADYQNQANRPLQSLAQMSGIQIPDVGPVALNGGTLNAPSAGVMPQSPEASAPAAPPVEAPASGAQAPLIQQTASGYRVRHPENGQVFTIPQEHLEAALKAGGVRV